MHLENNILFPKAAAIEEQLNVIKRNEGLPMVSSEAVIRVVVIMNSEEYILETFPHEYRNLMMLICDRMYPEDFGECKGIGRCGTCHIQISNDNGELRRIWGNETATLSKTAFVRESSRLACHIPIDEKLDGVVIRLITENE